MKTRPTPQIAVVRDDKRSVDGAAEHVEQKMRRRSFPAEHFVDIVRYRSMCQ
jgi:hypothetical protein